VAVPAIEIEAVPVPGVWEQRARKEDGSRHPRAGDGDDIVSKLILKNTQEAKVIGPRKICNIFCRGLQLPGKI
jgi:hypothetical protein